MSFPGKVLRAISRTTPLDPAALQKYEALLVDNWFDSEQTLRQVPAATLERLGIPKFIAEELEEALKNPGGRLPNLPPRGDGKVSASEMADPAKVVVIPSQQQNDPAVLHLLNYTSTQKDQGVRREALAFLLRALTDVLRVGEEIFFTSFSQSNVEAQRLVWSNDHLTSMVSDLWPIKRGPRPPNSQQAFHSRIIFVVQALEDLQPTPVVVRGPVNPKADHRQIWMDILTKLEDEFSALYKPQGTLVDHHTHKEYTFLDRKGFSEKSLEALQAKFDKFKRNFSAEIATDDSISSEIWKVEAMLRQRTVQFQVLVGDHLTLTCRVNRAVSFGDLLAFIRGKLVTPHPKFFLQSRERGTKISENDSTSATLVGESGFEDGHQFVLAFEPPGPAKSGALFLVQQIF